MPRKPHILVVDDDDGIRHLVSRLLVQEGYEVVAVSDGAAALEAVATAGKPYDLVITNNRMPGMDGAELVARLRQGDPRLAIVHLDDQSLADEPPLPSDVPTVAKPFDLERLKREVSRLLGAG
jgi:CheY-like chemotaxis protein